MRYTIIIVLLISSFKLSAQLFDTTKTISKPKLNFIQLDSIFNGNNNYLLYLDNREIDSIPPTIGLLKKTIYIALYRNKIKYLPNEIGQLSSIETLRLESNCIAKLPKSFSKLKTLKTVGLANNGIQNFPNQLLRLSNLELIDLSKNKLTTIPSQIRRLKKLKYLLLQENNFSEQSKKKLKELLPNCEIYFEYKK